jgi:hypothetical protein
LEQERRTSVYDQHQVTCVPNPIRVDEVTQSRKLAG